MRQDNWKWPVVVGWTKQGQKYLILLSHGSCRSAAPEPGLIGLTGLTGQTGQTGHFCCISSDGKTISEWNAAEGSGRSLFHGNTLEFELKGQKVDEIFSKDRRLWNFSNVKR